MQFHTEKCQEYANGKACFVAGVNPKKAGESILNIPIYASVKEAAAQTGATVSVIYVPPPQARLPPSGRPWRPTWTWRSASPKAFPFADMLEVRNKHEAPKKPQAAKKPCCSGPNCPGLITPDEIKIGIMPGHIHRKGRIGVVCALRHAHL